MNFEENAVVIWNQLTNIGKQVFIIPKGISCSYRQNLEQRQECKLT